MVVNIRIAGFHLGPVAHQKNETKNKFIEFLLSSWAQINQNQEALTKNTLESN